jgi:hypothetical protein
MLGVHPTGPYRHYPPSMADAAFQYSPLPRDTAKRLPWLRKVKAKFGRGPSMVVLSSMHWEIARWVQVRTVQSSQWRCASHSSHLSCTTGSNAYQRTPLVYDGLECQRRTERSAWTATVGALLARTASTAHSFCPLQAQHFNVSQRDSRVTRGGACCSVGAHQALLQVSRRGERARDGVHQHTHRRRVPDQRAVAAAPGQAAIPSTRPYPSEGVNCCFGGAVGRFRGALNHCPLKSCRLRIPFTFGDSRVSPSFLSIPNVPLFF